VGETANPDLGVVLVHGVGFGPETMSAVEEALQSSATVHTLTRPGYRATGELIPMRSVDEQLDPLTVAIKELSRSHRRVVLAGVSGGATLGLALAMRGCERLDAVVLHEPLVGPGAPELHGRIAEAAAKLRNGGTTENFLASMVGADRWATLPPRLRRAALGRESVIRSEVPSFAAFAPTTADLCRARDIPITTTIGSHSGPARRAAADLIERCMGATRSTITGAGHLVQLDRPEQYATCILDAMADPPVGQSLIAAHRPDRTNNRPIDEEAT
jgi:pimeloyl-ACP methyl ester carboxylesterase